MVNMLVVDDEPLMREGLSCIPWSSIGVNLVGSVSSGMEALTVMGSTPVQILFTDIQMPDISGLELIRAALIIDPDVRSVILTGHNRFEYAREAISLHVYDYILKPCDPNEVLGIIGKLAAEIEEAAVSAFPASPFQADTRDSVASVLLSVFANLTLLPEDVLLLQKSDFFSGGPYFIACCSCSASDISHAAAFWEHSNDPRFRILCIRQSADHFVLLIHACTDTEEFRAAALAWLTASAQTLQMQNCSVKIAAGPVVSESSEVLTAYTGALQCSDYFFSHETESVLCTDQIRFGSSLQADLNELQSRILSFTEQMNYQCTDEALLSLEMLFASSWISGTQIRMTAINLLMLSCGLIAQKRNDVFSGLTAEQLLSLNQSASLSDLFSYLRSALRQCIATLNNSSNASAHYLVRECLEYIETHYTEDISAASAAAKLHTNPDYLSRVLKKESGFPFGQLLTNFRLEKACSLLSDPDLSISEISVMVGFHDFRYFGQVFKNRYKMTPRAYRKFIKKQS